MTAPGEQPTEGTGRARAAPVIAAAAAVLGAAGVASPRVDAEFLAGYVLGVPRSRLPLTDGFTAADLGRYQGLVARRASREPLQHLMGSAAFRHIEVAVGPGVFVPRPETELLAGWGVAAARDARDTRGAAAGRGEVTVVDLGSGTGAIALAVANEVPDARVYAVERSPRALVWLRRNAADRAAAGDAPAEVVAGDVTDPRLLEDLAGRVDVLLCNPPYVPRGTAVPPEVADHDPAEAVFGGADGLDVIRPVIDRASTLLRPGGAFGIEHDETHAQAVPDLLAAHGGFVDITGHRDLAGRPRFATARRAGAARPAGPAGAWQTFTS